jgi:hypothetical protein
MQEIENRENEFFERERKLMEKLDELEKIIKTTEESVADSLKLKFHSHSHSLCDVPGCDGKGNTNGRANWHTSRRNCPKIRECNFDFVFCIKCQEEKASNCWYHRDGYGRHLQSKHK